MAEKVWLSIFAWRLLDTKGRCLARLLEAVLMEQFAEGLSGGMVDWVRCYWPLNLDAAMALAEDRLAVQLKNRVRSMRGVGRGQLVPAQRRKLPGPEPVTQTRKRY